MSGEKYWGDGPPAVCLAWYGPYPALLVGFGAGPGEAEVMDITDPPPLPGWAVHVAGSTLVRVTAAGGRGWSAVGEGGHPVELPARWLGSARELGGVLIVLDDLNGQGTGQDLGDALTAASAAGRFGLAPVITAGKA